MEILFFPSPAQFRKWLKANYAKATELWLGYYKVNSGKPSITYKQSVEEALCYGWIDGICKSIDTESYMQRFTPRKANSIWSNVNINSVKNLIEEGRMQPAGLAAFEKRTEKKSGVYAFEQGDLTFGPFEKIFKKNKEAWAFFQSQPPSYTKPAMWWVINAKREETKIKRLQTLMDDSTNGKRLAHLSRSKPK